MDKSIKRMLTIMLIVGIIFIITVMMYNSLNEKSSQMLENEGIRYEILDDVTDLVKFRDIEGYEIEFNDKVYVDENITDILREYRYRVCYENDRVKVIEVLSLIEGETDVYIPILSLMADEEDGEVYVDYIVGLAPTTVDEKTVLVGYDSNLDLLNLDLAVGDYKGRRAEYSPIVIEGITPNETKLEVLSNIGKDWVIIDSDGVIGYKGRYIIMGEDEEETVTIMYDCS